MTRVAEYYVWSVTHKCFCCSCSCCCRSVHLFLAPFSATSPPPTPPSSSRTCAASSTALTAFCAASSSGGAAAAADRRFEALPPEADAPATRLAAADPFLAAGDAGAGEGLAGVGAGAGAAAAALSDEGNARPEGFKVGGAAEWGK